MCKTLRIALIPAYEPDGLLIELLLKLKENGFESVVVDDGSGEAYKGFFSRAEKAAVVLTHADNRGKGSALKTGLKYIAENYSENVTVITLDADGQHTVEDAIKAAAAAEELPNALILGSRVLKNEKIPLRSKFGNAVTRGVFRLSTGVKIYDTQTGLRAFSKAFIPQMLKIPGERYEYEMNVLLFFAKERVEIKEVGIKAVYINNNSASHFNAVKDSYRIYREILCFSGSSFVCFLLDYTLYSLFSMLSGGTGAVGVSFPNIAARLISSVVNYNLNKRLVFKSKESTARSAPKYFLLAAFILAGNTVVLNLLTGIAGINAYIAKLLTEMCFFVINWCFQRFFVFRKGASSK